MIRRLILAMGACIIGGLLLGNGIAAVVHADTYTYHSDDPGGMLWYNRAGGFMIETHFPWRSGTDSRLDVLPWQTPWAASASKPNYYVTSQDGWFYKGWQTNSPNCPDGWVMWINATVHTPSGDTAIYPRACLTDTINGPIPFQQ